MKRIIAQIIAWILNLFSKNNHYSVEPKKEEIMEKERSEKRGQLPIPKCFRRNPNAGLPAYLRGQKFRNDRSPHGQFNQIGIGKQSMTTQDIQQCRQRRKFKGWQREARMQAKRHHHKSAA